MQTNGVVATLSPSMDIQVSSNFERALFDAYGRDGTAISGLMAELSGGGFSISQGAIGALREAFSSGSCSKAVSICLKPVGIVASINLPFSSSVI